MKNHKFWQSISEQLYTQREKVLYKSCWTISECTKIHANMMLILIYINPATIPATFRESLIIDQVYRKDIWKHLYTNAEYTFYKTYNSTLEEPKNLGRVSRFVPGTKGLSVKVGSRYLEFECSGLFRVPIFGWQLAWDILKKIIFSGWKKVLEFFSFVFGVTRLAKNYIKNFSTVIGSL